MGNGRNPCAANLRKESNHPTGAVATAPHRTVTRPADPGASLDPSQSRANPPDLTPKI